ncbi:serine hydrolase [Ruegeria sp. HKCCA4633]|nr:serine hydrolase domain-containing protein [Ruegeria sp. HKCCA4633]
MPNTSLLSKSNFPVFALIGGLIMQSLGTSPVHAEDDPYATPREDFSIRDLRNGYSAKQAYDLSSEWNLQKFLDITEAGAFSYMNLAEFLPSSVIRRDGAVAMLATNFNDAIGATSVPGADGNAVSLDEMINADDSTVQGVMVLHNGEIAYEAYPGMRRTDNHVWMSNAKILSSLLIGQLEDEGKIDVQKTVGDYVDGTKGTAWENIKVIDVLNMQSGLDLEENPLSRKGDTPYGRFVRAEVGVPNEEGVLQTHNEALFAIPKLREPAEAFEYSSANTQMLGLVIEAVTNQRLGEAITERVWSKAGMTGDATLALSPQGNGIIHGLISSRLIDMAKIGLLYTPSWDKTASDRIVSEKMIDTIQTAGVAENYMKGTLGPHLSEAFREQPMANAYQWDAVFADGDFYKSGMNGQGIYVSPGKDAVVVWYATGGASIDMEAYARAIVTSL